MQKTNPEHSPDLPLPSSVPEDPFAVLREEVDQRLDQLLPPETYRPSSLHTAMRYACLNGGKRVRPLLCLLVNEAAGGSGRAYATDAACAVEMVHCASLILDDLPCMDDAGLRRGRTTAHREFGESTAILAAFGLLNRAFEVMTRHNDCEASVKSTAIGVLSSAIGSDGLIAGQEIDLHSRSNLDNVSQFETLNWLKTGVLFVACVELGGLAAQLEAPAMEGLRRFARHIGIAFQIGDDLIDQHSNVITAGKDVRQDTDKPSLLKVLGPQKARQSIDDHLEQGLRALAESGLAVERISTLINTVLGRYPTS